METVIIAHPERRIIAKKYIQVEQSLKDIQHEDHLIYVPSSLMEELSTTRSVKVYFELEAFPFFQKFKEIIEQNLKPKGVFRYRRKCRHDVNESLLVEDLYVIVSLFGEPEDIFVKRTSKEKIPYYVIVTLNFCNGTMAHVEYTISDKEQIEMEWSGIQQILEFQSEEMNALISDNPRSSSLVITAEEIVKTAHSRSESFIRLFEKCRNWLKEGAVW